MAYDRFFQKKIVRAIREELERSNEMADEVWLTEKQLIEEMPFFKKNWRQNFLLNSEKDLTKVIYAICACFTDVFQFVTHCVTN